MVLHTKYIILIKIRLNTSNIIRRTIHKGIGYLRMHKDNISKLDSTPLFKVIQFQTHPPLGWKKRAQKGLFSTHPVSLRFYQPLDPKICLSSNSLWKEDPNKIKVILKLYSQASRPFSRLQLQFPKKKKKKKPPPYLAPNCGVVLKNDGSNIPLVLLPIIIRPCILGNGNNNQSKKSLSTG